MGGRTWISLGVCTLGLLLPAVAQAASARVRALNAGPSGAVTFRVDGVARATGLGVRRESPRFSLRPGRHTFTAVRGTRTVARRSILLGSGERVTIAYVVNRGQPELRLLREPAASSGAAQLRVANYAPRAGAVDVRAGGLVLARGLRFGATTVARRIPPGFSPTGLATIAARTRQGVDVAGTQPLVLATRSVGIFVLVPRGSGTQLLRLAYDVAPPTPTRQPAVTGTRRFGNVVRCERDTWTPRSAGIERQWTVDGAAAGSSTALALTTAAHAGHAIGCTVTATASGMTTVVRTTFALPAVPKLVGQPFVEFPAGALLPGDILTCNPGTWTVASPNFTIRWIRIGSGEEIGTGPTYILSVPADNGIVNSLGCAVVAASDGGTSPPIRSSNTIALGIAPTVAIVNASKPADRTVIKDAHFQWTIGGGGADTVECSLDGGPFIQCIGQLAQAYGAAQLTTGPSGIVHTFVVRVTNPVSTATDSYSWKLEPLPPTVAINLAPTNPTTATAATFGWTVGGGGAASIACELDGDPVLCSGAGVTLPGLATDADGVSHRFIVRATNTNPTTPTTSALFDWEVRPLAPSLSGLGVNPGEGAPPGPFDLTFAVDGPTTSITCQIDGALPVIDPCTSPQSFADPGPGPHTIVVTATNITGFDTQPVDWTFVP